MHPLETPLCHKLKKTVKDARDIAENTVRSALQRAAHEVIS